MMMNSPQKSKAAWQFLALSNKLLLKKAPKLLFADAFHRTTFGGPMIFDDKPWLVALYADDHPFKVVEKCVQVGVSDMAIVHMLYWCWQGYSTLYVLPDDDVCASFVFNRIKPIFDDSKFYASALTPGSADNVRLKKLWKGTTKFVGCRTRKSMREYPADRLIVDELDECNLEILAWARDRLAAARIRTGAPPEELDISNPSVEDYGIDARYLQSDQKEWRIKCEHCNEWQTLDWFVHAVEQTARLHYDVLDKEWFEDKNIRRQRDMRLYCSSCHKPINRFGKAQWVANRPQVLDSSGYRISQLFTSQTTIGDIHGEFTRSLAVPILRQRFHNSILGQPYREEGNYISPELLASCVDPEYYHPVRWVEPKKEDEKGKRIYANPVVMGVDVGGEFHVKISELMPDGKRRSLFIGRIPVDEDWASLSALLKAWHVDRCVVDMEPEISAAKKFRKQHPGIVFLCDYPPNPTKMDLGVDLATRLIKVDKHQSLDESYAEYAQGHIILPADYRSIDKGEFVKQMGTPKRIYTQRGAAKILQATWSEGGKPDHYRHADNYENMAANLFRRNVPRVS